MIRSMLFIPSNTPNMLVNAGDLGADAIIFDLEDAVAPEMKDSARFLLMNALASLNFGKSTLIVRINGCDSPYWEQDLEAVIPLKPDAIMPPKVSDSEYIHRVDEKISQLGKKYNVHDTKIIALLETAEGIENAFIIAKSSPRMAGLFLGAEDLTADLHSRRTKEGKEILYAREKVVSAARAAGIEAYDTPFTDVRDNEGLKIDAEFAKGLGFSGKACISPLHVDIINEAFSPSEKEIEYALKVLEIIEEAKQQGKGAVSLYGKMIDAPIVARARQTIEAAKEGGLL